MAPSVGVARFAPRELAALACAFAAAGRRAEGTFAELVAEVAERRGVGAFSRAELERVWWACCRLVVEASALHRALKADERLRSIVATCPAPRISPEAATSTLASHPRALVSPSRRGIAAWS